MLWELFIQSCICAPANSYKKQASSTRRKSQIRICQVSFKHKCKTHDWLIIGFDWPSGFRGEDVSFFLFFFFFSVLRPFQDYFSSYETGQSVGGAKTGEPREKPPDTPASRTWLVSQVATAGLEPTPDTAVR